MPTFTTAYPFALKYITAKKVQWYRKKSNLFLSATEAGDLKNLILHRIDDTSYIKYDYH